MIEDKNAAFAGGMGAIAQGFGNLIEESSKQATDRRMLPFTAQENYETFWDKGKLQTRAKSTNFTTTLGENAVQQGSNIFDVSAKALAESMKKNRT
jgi:hypothetical protein